ncbi:MAG: DNA-binding domain-containing protein [Alphaproteobacteria bacterium]|nr:DNA-binding domain-containing protein [Alphaproteobacteria bacterium]
MGSLFSLQEEFLKFFLNSSFSLESIKANGVKPHNRLSIYRNNITEALRKALFLTYPLTWELIGEECANGAAYAFIREGTSLPMVGNLEEWGENFPDFLEKFLPTQSLSYLPDFARFEWLKHLAYRAKDATPLDSHDFKGMDPESYSKLILKLHPSAQLFSSLFPLDQILSVVEGAVDSTQLENRKSHVLIIRPFQSVNVHWLSEPYFLFFALLEQGLSLRETLEELDDTEIQLYEILSFSLKNRLFSTYNFVKL